MTLPFRSPSVAAIVLTLAAALFSGCNAGTEPSPAKPEGQKPPLAAKVADASLAKGSGGMVSSAHPLATEAGLAILRAGGNAFDAAVTVAASLNVVEPMMSGMGGYGTTLIYSVDEKKVRFLNSSGRIPAGLDSDVFRAPTPGYLDNRRGAKGVSTPGNARAWQALVETYGSLPWATLLEPAIALAEDGFVLDPRTAAFIAHAFESFPEHARAFYGRDGEPLAAGELLVQKDLARSLGLVAEGGAEVVHGGEIGQAIDRAMRQADGFLTLDDLRQNEAEWWPSIHVVYRGYEVHTAAPPANAFPALVRLGMMSRFDPAELGHNTPAFLHRFAEVTKHAFWTRLRFAGDPEVTPPPLEKLLSEEYWSEQTAKIDPAHATPFVPPTELAEAARHTTHFVVADRHGNVVSATQTLGNLFGSRIMPEGTGIWLNNSLAYCTFEPAGNPMDAHAGRHKLSGDVPVIVLRDGRPWIALGTPGGHTIGQTVPQMLINLLDFKMELDQALAAGRISFIEPDELAVERRIDEATHDALRQLGHKVRAVDGLGNAHALLLEVGEDGIPIAFQGAADPRGSGLAEGLE